MRKDKNVLEEERSEFVSLGNLSDTVVLDCFGDPSFKPNMVDNYDAIFIGGMSDDPSDSVELTKELFPFIDNLKSLVLYCVEQGKPTFASCGGFQIAAEALGGSVVLDKENAELGCYEISLSGNYKSDPLLFDFPESFLAISGHNKRVDFLPEACELFAHSDLCPVHIFKVKNNPFYAFQFHPEITAADFIKRVEPYWEKYFPSREVFEGTVEKLKNTELSNTLIKKFVDRIVLGDNT